MGMKEDDPLYVKMKGVIWSPEGQQAALDATKNGWPAICGVDPLLQKHLGNEYRHIAPANMGLQLTLAAGAQVALVMGELGYTKAGSGSCPKAWGCVAKTGAKWKPKG